MEVREALLTRRSIRAYDPRPISDEDLNYVLEAGLNAPSAINLQPWYFVVVRSSEQMAKLTGIMKEVSTHTLAELEERFPNHPQVVQDSVSFIRQLGGAPVCVLAFLLNPNYGAREYSALQSVCGAIENMLLAATDRGLGSCWLTAVSEAGFTELVRQTFAPDKGPLVAVVSLGHPAQSPKAPPRKPGRYEII